MGEKVENWAWQPSVSPPLTVEIDEHWRNFDSSVNAVSFGFVATAILISMFLVMAIFERFLRPNSPEIPSSGTGDRGGDIESQMGFHPKLGFPSPKMTVYTKGVSVLMPGENFPTFIAHPAPMRCPPDRVPWPLPKHIRNPPRNSNASTRSS